MLTNCLNLTRILAKFIFSLLRSSSIFDIENDLNVPKLSTARF